MISAAVIDSTGEPVAGIPVALVPVNYNFLKNPLGVGKTRNQNSPTLIPTTISDASGNIQIETLDSGLFNLVAATDQYKFKLYVPSIHIGPAPVINLDKVYLRTPGTIMVKIDSSVFKTGSSLLVLGSLIFAPVEQPGIVALKVPCGSISIQYVTSSGDSIAGGPVLRNISVGEGETVLEPYGQGYSGWKFSRMLSLNTTASGAGVSGNVLNFPVLVRLTAGNFDFTQAGTAGADIRFTKQDNTPVPYEIERWDASQGSAEIWIKVDTVYGNDSTHFINMFWGNPDATAASNSVAVFDTASGFQGVWHMGQVSGTTANDATSNHYDGTPFNSTSISTVTGMVGAAQKFSGQSGYFEMLGTESSKLNFPRNGTYAVSAWAYADTIDNQFRTIASKGDFQYNLEVIKEGYWEFAEFGDKTGWDQTTNPAVAKTWVYLTGVRAGPKEYLYFDGTLSDSTIGVLPDTTNIRNTTFDFMVGRIRKTLTDTISYFYKGMIDEVRITSTVPSAAWVRLCYMNQRTDDKLVTFK
jgi:hypothetical protein